MFLDNKKSISKIIISTSQKRYRLNISVFFCAKKIVHFFYLYKNKLEHFILEHEEKRRKNEKI